MGRKTVLVVDDNRQVREVVVAILGAEDFLILQAENGREAIETARDAAPDLVLLDISMPEMNGIEVCQKLKGNAPTVGAKVIMLTGRSTPSDLTDSLRARADRYLAKPFSPVELLDTVRDLL